MGLFDFLNGWNRPLPPYKPKGSSSSKNKQTLLNTTVRTGGKEYQVYKSGNKYFYDKGNMSVLLDSKYYDLLKKNKNWSVDIDSKSSKPQAQPQPQPNYNYGGGGGYPGYGGGGGGSDRTTQALLQKIYELEHPRVYSAQELADIYGIDYNEQNILNDYNKATNEYYDAAVKDQNDLRTQYIRNNAEALDNITSNYLDSYKNTTPTTVKQGTLAANALSTMLNAGDINADNDYGMAQSVNQLEETRKAELAGNASAARDYYNRIGTYLSTLSANKNASDVKQYVSQLDAYANMYADKRATAAAQASAAASRYAGLARAQSVGAQSAANNNRLSGFNNLYNYYLQTNSGNAYQAANSIKHNLLNSR